MIAMMKSLVLATLVLTASAARAEEYWQVEGAFPLFPGQAGSTTASIGSSKAVVAVAPVAAPKAPVVASGCHFKVLLTSPHAVGEPCLTTTDVMNRLGLNAKAQARVEHLATTRHAKHAAKKTAH